MANHPKKAGEPISKKHAKSLVENFKKKFPVKNKSAYYTLDVFERLMKLPGCVGIRIYAGMEDDLFTPVLVGVDQNGNNIYNYSSASILTASDEDVSSSAIEERGLPCPPYCPENDL